MLHIKFCIDDKIFTSLASAELIGSYVATNLKNIVKFYVPTWTIFAGPIIRKYFLCYNIVLQETVHVYSIVLQLGC